MLSRICQWQKYLDGSRSYQQCISQTGSCSMERRSCQDSIEKKPRDLDGSKFRQDLSRKEERMARLKRTCWGSIEKLSSLKKKSFSRREKHIEMNAASKLLKHRSNQHIKLSNTHLSTYMQSIHRSKTHTLTNFISRFKMWSLTDKLDSNIYQELRKSIFQIWYHTHPCVCV